MDDLIVFHALSEKNLGKIVEIQLGRLRNRLEEKNIELELTESARKHLVEVGYDPSFGARPLKRTITKEVETPLARQILEGKIKDGSKVTVDFDQGRSSLVFSSLNLRK